MADDSDHHKPKPKPPPWVEHVLWFFLFGFRHWRITVPAILVVGVAYLATEGVPQPIKDGWKFVSSWHVEPDTEEPQKLQSPPITETTIYANITLTEFLQDTVGKPKEEIGKLLARYAGERVQWTGIIAWAGDEKGILFDRRIYFISDTTYRTKYESVTCWLHERYWNQVSRGSKIEFTGTVQATEPGETPALSECSLTRVLVR